jgi:retinol-binding protein 3
MDTERCRSKFGLGVLLAVLCATGCREPARTAPREAPATDGLVASQNPARVASDESSPPAPGPPPTAAGAQLALWLASFNSRDKDALIAYHRQHFPYEVASADVANIERELGLSQATGGFELKRVEDSAATRLTVTLAERRRLRFARATLEVDPAAPQRVVRFEIHPIAPPRELLPGDPAGQLDAAKRRSLIDGIARELKAHYVFAEAAVSMSTTLDAHAAAGDYDSLSEGPAFAQAVTNDLREVSRDDHLTVAFGRHSSDAVQETREEQIQRFRDSNFRFGALDRLSGHVAHLVITGFVASEDPEVRDAIGGLMTQVADARALLLDLRDNHGGHPDTVAFVASYLFDATPVHLGDIYRRDDGSTQEFWTASKVPGTRFGPKKPVYVLTSKRTFSGGEDLAYGLQAQGRARVVGETTRGGAHPCAPYSLDEWFYIVVPWGRSINPVTHTNWQGVGVVPDVAVPADRALDEAHRRAIQDLSSVAR